jgi:hypothetical protein
MKNGISDFGFRISDFPPDLPLKDGWVGEKSEIRNPKSEIGWGVGWT